MLTCQVCRLSKTQSGKESLRMSEVDLENELIAAGQDEETAFYKVS